ncbi:SGNH/GDSL hydrolase family protein [Pontibacter arcticus]|uniref:G-D-S-L family lipolytic protein n=1 Tax=Pontibacter arcticus TaxID=2080288 RepID=A0A364RJC5_9BACT|nr:G-D-S-L family lipolytic protein [Pontibacter arcticus]RAU84375.1 G-D-S-L family lipolytic protein [Pontibacter arcticus]
MKKIFYRSSMLALFAGVLLTSCDPEIDAPASSAGSADFTKYIAVGNSLTAGFSDNGLSLEGQVNSYPAILAQQFKAIGGGDFAQPLFTEAQRNGSGYIRLAGFTATGSPITAPVTENLALRAPNSSLLTKYTEPVNNYGIPGIRVADINTPGYGSAAGNPYFERITPDAQAMQTYLQRVQQSTDHTFFSLWLGNNDILGFATAGGFAGAITETGTFNANYSAMVDALTAKGAKGIVATIPDVTGVPFFTTVGPQVKAALTAAKSAGFVAFTGSATNVDNTKNRTLVPTATIKDATGGTVLFTLTGSAYAGLIGRPTGKYWKDLAKQQSPSPAAVNLVLAGLLSRYAIDTTKALGAPENPWPSALIVDATELKAIEDATKTFNDFIKAQATAKSLAIFDANAYFTSIQGGFSSYGVAYSPAFITGNLFSLDGVHPTPRGYAFIANEMIKSINAKYSAKLQTVDETQYRTVVFP